MALVMDAPRVGRNAEALTVIGARVGSLRADSSVHHGSARACESHTVTSLHTAKFGLRRPRPDRARYRCGEDCAADASSSRLFSSVSAAIVAAMESPHRSAGPAPFDTAAAQRCKMQRPWRSRSCAHGGTRTNVRATKMCGRARACTLVYARARVRVCPGLVRACEDYLRFQTHLLLRQVKIVLLLDPSRGRDDLKQKPNAHPPRHVCEL
jgi:hypothetical protein